MFRKEIKEQLLMFKNEAKAQAERACALAASPKEAELKDCVHRYVCAKFFLSPETDPERLLYNLACDSIEQAINMKIPIAKESETATTCGAAGSAAVKVALLMVALRKDFHVDIPSEKLAFIKNTNELGHIVFESMRP